MAPNGYATKLFRARKWKNKIERIPKCLTPNANKEETCVESIILHDLCASVIGGMRTTKRKDDVLVDKELEKERTN